MNVHMPTKLEIGSPNKKQGQQKCIQMGLTIAIGFPLYLAGLEFLDQAKSSALEPGRAAERCLRHKGQMHDVPSSLVQIWYLERMD